MTTKPGPDPIIPGFYWFIPYEPGVEPHPVEITTLDDKHRMLADKTLDISLVAWYIGEGWYEPLEDLMAEGTLTRLEPPRKT